MPAEDPRHIRIALKYQTELGLSNIIPSHGKAPSNDWKRWATERMGPEDIRREFKRGGRSCNFWAPTGVVNGYVVVDVDNDAGEALLREHIATALDATALVRTGSGKSHYWFKLPEGSDGWDTWRVHSKDDPEAPSFDVQCNGAGVAVPPTVHPDTGEKYRWERGLTTAVEAPEWLVRAPKGMEAATGGDGPRSKLAALLESVPQGEGSGRNDWLARVCGHLAAQTRYEDAYTTLALEQAAKIVDDTFGQAEADRTIRSIWEKDNTKVLRLVPDPEDGIGVQHPTEANGWLVGTGDQLLTECKVKGEDNEAHYMLDVWADFDIKATGVVEDTNTPTQYFVTLKRLRDQVEIQTLLPAKDLADTKRITAWLAQFRVSVLPPEGIRHRQAPGTRLMRYLDAQNPPSFTVLPCLGYDIEADGFVTPEGVIREDGLHPHATSTPDPGIVEHFQGAYGMDASMEEARAVLNEVLSFHDSEAAGVFGAWWAACLLKPLFIQQSSLFPNFGVEATSGKGKSKGLFGILVELSGAAGLTGNLTPAALRAQVETTRGTILQIDDADDITNLTELLRASTTEAAITKMAGDNFSHVKHQVMRAPILITGEAIGIHYEKALRDRFVLLKPSDASARTSRRRERAGLSQWDDVVAFRRRYPKLNRLAGSMAQLAIQQRSVVALFPELRGVEGKRHGDKVAVIRTGGRLLVRMTGDPSWADVVDRWADELEVPDERANTLMLRTLPNLLQRFHYPTAPMPQRDGDPPTPVLVIAGRVCGNSKAIAAWTERLKFGPASERTETEQAVTEQARDLGYERKAHRPGKAEARDWYWALPEDVSGRIMSLAAGDMDDHAPEGA